MEDEDSVTTLNVQTEHVGLINVQHSLELFQQSPDVLHQCYYVSDFFVGQVGKEGGWGVCYSKEKKILFEPCVVQILKQGSAILGNGSGWSVLEKNFRMMTGPCPIVKTKVPHRFCTFEIGPF